MKTLVHKTFTAAINLPALPTSFLLYKIYNIVMKHKLTVRHYPTAKNAFAKIMHILSVFVPSFLQTTKLV